MGRNKNALSETGKLLFGKYTGVDIEVVVEDNPGYLRWFINNIDDLDPDDYSIIRDHLSRAGELNE